MRHLADTFVDDPRELFSVHQTVVGKVVERDEEAQKVTMSAKLKDVRDGGTAAAVGLTRSLFRDFAKVRESATGGALSTFAPGQPTTCTVTRATDLGIFVDVQVRGGCLHLQASLVNRQKAKDGGRQAYVILTKDMKWNAVMPHSASESVWRP